jgi:hypothetical protein
MEDNWISSLPIVNRQWELIWVLTKNDTVRNEVYVPSLNKKWQLDVAVALSLNWFKNYIDEIINSWVNTIFLDTAHWYTQRMLDTIKYVRDKYEEIIIIWWNIMTSKWANDLIESWANWVKVWIWPWAMCTTRMMTWVWRPQFTAIYETALTARENWWFAIADWWIKNPRDLALSIAAWATHGMFWTVLSWTYESPWDIKTDSEWLLYKENYWMASKLAVNWRTNNLSKFEQAKRIRFEEGISKSKIYWIKALWDLIDEYRTWLESAISYTWSKNIEDFYKNVVIWVQTQSWFYEWTAHGKLRKVWKNPS